MFGFSNEFANLENGSKIPKVGFGTWPMTDEQCYNAVKAAISAGYR